MAYTRQQQEEIIRKLQQQEQMEQYRNNQKRYTPNRAVNDFKTAKNIISNSGRGLQNFGNLMSKSSNPTINTLGSKVGNAGTKLVNFSQTPNTLKAGISNMFGSSAPSLAGTTGAGGSAIANGIGSMAPVASSALPSTIGATGGIGAGVSGLGAGSAAGTGALGSSALGSSLLGVTGGGTAAGMGAAGATSALGGATAGATAAGAGAGAASAGAGAGLAAGAGGALAAGSMAIPVAGWVVAAALAAKAIKDKFDEAQQKVNKKAMEADANAMQASGQTALKNRQAAQQRMMQQAEADANAMAQPMGEPTGQSQVNSSDIANEIMNRIGQPSGVEGQLPPLQQHDTSGDVPNELMNMAYQPQQGITGGAAPVENNVEFTPLPPIQVTEDAKGNIVPDNGDVKTSIMDKLRSGLRDFNAGYVDNSEHGFTEGDMFNNITDNTPQPSMTEDGTLTGGAAQTKKSIMARLGEAAGTGRRLMANPWVQAGIAGAISKADGGDIGDIAKAAYQYGTAKQKADSYYRMMNPDAKVMPVFNTLDANDYKAKAYNDFNQGRTMISRRDFIKLNNPTWSDSQVDAYISGLGIDGDEMLSLKGYDSVTKAQAKNKDLDIKDKKVEYDNNYHNQKIGVDKQKVGVQQGKLKETIKNNEIKNKQNQEKINIAKDKANNKKGKKKVSYKIDEKGNGAF